MATPELLNVEVAYALPERQVIMPLQVAGGTTAGEAVELARLERFFPGLDCSDSPLGVFSEKVARDYVLREGDRVEVYRPLQADPKAVRREMAKLGKSMRKPRAAAAD